MLLGWAPVMSITEAAGSSPAGASSKLSETALLFAFIALRIQIILNHCNSALLISAKQVSECLHFAIYLLTLV